MRSFLANVAGWAALWLIGPVIIGALARMVWIGFRIGWRF